MATLSLSFLARCPPPPVPVTPSPRGAGGAGAAAPPAPGPALAAPRRRPDHPPGPFRVLDQPPLLDHEGEVQLVQLHAVDEAHARVAGVTDGEPSVGRGGAP